MIVWVVRPGHDT